MKTEESADYKLGYRHGCDSDMPNTRGVFDREAYFTGYATGSQERDEWLARGEGHVPVPEWMTPAQVEAVNKLYWRSADGARNRRDFFTRVTQCGIGSDLYAGIHWGNMFVGIEPDGYTHT